MNRRSKSKAWMREHVNDAFVKRARADGFRSRAAYKLTEIVKRDRLLRPGITVVDLGAAPGSWSQVVAATVGASGTIIALDVLEMASLPSVTFVQGDFRKQTTLASLQAALAGRPIDLVLSDMSPNISGIATSDQARVMELAELALGFAVNHLREGGSFLVKVFQGAGFEGFLRVMRGDFERVTARKPEASRDRSSEVYLLGSGARRGIKTRPR